MPASFPDTVQKHNPNYGQFQLLLRAERSRDLRSEVDVELIQVDSDTHEVLKELDIECGES